MTKSVRMSLYLGSITRGFVQTTPSSFSEYFDYYSEKLLGVVRFGFVQHLDLVDLVVLCR